MIDQYFYLHPVFWAIGLCLIIQVGVYLLLFRKLAVHKPLFVSTGSGRGVSIVISAKDEAENLAENLPSILEQEYPIFEVIVVDDQSEDGTKDLLADFATRYPHLKIITIAPHVNEFRGKKLALTLAFKAASYETLLLTDADCKPSSAHWLQLMESAYTDKNTEFVLGYSPYKKYKGLVNLLIRYETFYTALQYFSFALNGRPYMGVGRNLSYKKALFFAKKGFSPYLKVVAGDDDLFVNMHANSKNTAVQLCPDSFMLSEPKRTWSAWMNQKKRHLSVSPYYKGGDKRRLGLLWFSNVLFYASIVIGCIIPGLWIPTLGIFIVRMVMQCIIFGMASRKLYYKNIWLWAPILDIFFQLLLMPSMALNGLLSKKKNW